MFDVSRAIQIGVKFKTASLTQELQSISFIFRDMVTPVTSLGSIFWIHIFCYYSRTLCFILN